MVNQYQDLITVDELCEILLISRSVAYQLLSSGQIKCFRINRKWKIPRSSVYQDISDLMLSQDSHNFHTDRQSYS